jgi:hypothetical protein
MKNNQVAFQFLDEEEQVPIGYKWIICLMTFDVKMDFAKKAHYFAGGRMTDHPSTIT